MTEPEPGPTAAYGPRPAVGHGGGHRGAVFTAFLSNLAIAAAKFVGFAFTGSASLLAEAIHSVADTGNQGLLMLGDQRSQQAPSDRHPFGYARERYFWAFVVSFVLFTGGGLFALYEGEEKLRNPHKLESLGWAVGILVVSMAFESISLRTAVRSSRPLKAPGESWLRFIRHSKEAELPVVLLEDTGALVGLAFALIGVLIAALTGNPRFDAIGSIAIGLLLVVIALTLAVEMKSLLIGEAASGDDLRRVRAAIEADARVRRVVKLQTSHLGPDELFVGAELEFDTSLSGTEVADAINDLEVAIQQAVPAANTVYVEPESPTS
ncbi:MAG: cation diffusion facilitator family transporter [Acidimicrobiia bacterium]